MYYRISEARQGAQCHIEFVRARDGQDWPVRVLNDEPIPSQALSAGRVVLSGRGSVWMYAHAAARAAASGAASICVESPAGSVQVYPVLCAQNDTHIHRWVLSEGAAGGRLHLTFQAPASGTQWAFDVLGLVPTLLAGFSSLLLTGRGAVWMYAAAAAEAVARGHASIHCLVPQEGGVFQVFPADGAGLDVSEAGSTVGTGCIVGIVGDPNSGKSVFSHVLNALCTQAGLESWRYDCDAASPTARVVYSTRDARRARTRQATAL